MFHVYWFHFYWFHVYWFHVYWFHVSRLTFTVLRLSVSNPPFPAGRVRVRSLHETKYTHNHVTTEHCHNIIVINYRGNYFTKLQLVKIKIKGREQPNKGGPTPRQAAQAGEM
jgi:hypothetical protein